MREIRTGAVSGKETFGQIGIGREETDGVAFMVEETENVESIVVLRRETVFGRETVIDGEDNGWETASETATNSDVRERGVAE